MPLFPEETREEGPSVGDYFLYCVLNRMVEAVSKNRLADWYKGTAIQHLRPVDLDELTSQRYWEKWDRVSEDALQEISLARFFSGYGKRKTPAADCLLFDTTNYYTFMASHTESDLAQRGKNKAGKHHLRQIGLGLLVARDSKLPLHCSVYPGNLHDSKQFEAIMDEMFGIVCGLNNTKERLTVVIDKGMNAEENFSWIDEHSRIHFITTYSTYFAQDLAATHWIVSKLSIWPRTNGCMQEDRHEDCLQAFRTKGEYWGKERTVVVTYNPRTARKKHTHFESKLETIRQELACDARQGARGSAALAQRRGRKGAISATLRKTACPVGPFRAEFEQSEEGLSMSFRKDPYKLKQKQAMFGKNIIITDNTDWTTAEIVEASLDRWQVEDQFRLSNDEDLVSARPVRHWTDSKIRFHLFTCVVAMTYLRMLERRLARAGIQRTADDVMADMRSCIQCCH